VPRACPLFSFPIFCSNPFYFSLLTFFPDSFFSSALASSFFFSPVLPAACLSCSPLFARTRRPAHDPPLPPLLAVPARSHHAARITPLPPRLLLLAMPLRACCPCTPSRRATRCCAGQSPSRPLALAACALSLSIPAAINGKVPVLPVILPCRPSPLSLSAYKSAPEPPLTPPTPPQHLPSSTSRCSSPPPLTIAGHQPSPWTALRRPSPHEVRAGIRPLGLLSIFPSSPGVAMHQGAGAHGLAAPAYHSPPPPVLSRGRRKTDMCITPTTFPPYAVRSPPPPSPKYLTRAPSISLFHYK
jgi:hypothetical protein